MRAMRPARSIKLIFKTVSYTLAGKAGYDGAENAADSAADETVGNSASSDATKKCGEKLNEGEVSAEGRKANGLSRCAAAGCQHSQKTGVPQKNTACRTGG